MAENRKKKNQQKLPWWLMPVLLFGGVHVQRGGAGARFPVVIRFADLRIDHHSAEGAV